MGAGDGKKKKKNTASIIITLKQPGIVSDDSKQSPT